MQLPVVLVLTCACLSVAQRHAVTISVPSNLTTYPLHRDVYGYSIEPVWLNDFMSNNMTSNLLKSITEVVGVPPPIRIGGTTADFTSLVPNLNVSAIAIPAPNGAKQFNISRPWFEAWGRYFDRATNFTYTLNLKDNSSSWATARAQAETAHSALGDRLVRFELGNEVDHYIAKGWRNGSWGIDAYAAQFRDLTGLIRNASWYRAAADRAPAFAAGSFADPPWVPDQHDELDDMDVLNLTTRAGLRNEKVDGAPTDSLHIDSFVVHMYPGSTCDAARWRRMRLDLLSNHTAVWQNVSQYGPQAQAAREHGRAPLVMGETNSISCGGRSGISDTLAAALWNVDYTLTLAAAVGVDRTYFHLGGQNEYSSWQPVAYTYKGEEIEPGVRPGWYAHYFLAHVVRPRDDDADGAAAAYQIGALPSANASDLSGFGVYRGSGGGDLVKLVLLDMGVWNGTEGLSNPSTIAATDNNDPAFHSSGERPRSEMTITTPWCAGAEVNVTRLSGPGSNAKSGVNVSGVAFGSDGQRSGQALQEVVVVTNGGDVKFNMTMAEGVLLEVARGCSQNSSAAPPKNTPVATRTALTVSLIVMAAMLL